MIAVPRLFAAVALLAAAVVSAAPSRDETYPACDPPSAAPVHGKCYQMSMKTDHNPFYLAPGLGACGVTYNDNVMGACLNPGWVHSGYHSSCGRKTTIINHANRKKVHVVIIDVCGAEKDSKFDCNDISLTKAAFVALGGDTTEGLLKNNVEWYFDDQHKAHHNGKKGGKRDE